MLDVLVILARSSTEAAEINILPDIASTSLYSSESPGTRLWNKRAAGALYLVTLEKRMSDVNELICNVKNAFHKWGILRTSAKAEPRS